VSPLNAPSLAREEEDGGHLIPGETSRLEIAEGLQERDERPAGRTSDVKPAAKRLRPIVGGLAASSWVAFDPIPAAVKFAATGVKFVLIFG